MSTEVSVKLSLAVTNVNKCISRASRLRMVWYLWVCTMRRRQGETTSWSWAAWSRALDWRDRRWHQCLRSGQRREGTPSSAGVSYGEQIRPLRNGGLVVVIHPWIVVWMRRALISSAYGDLPFVEEPPQGSELGNGNILEADWVGLGHGNDGHQCLRFSWRSENRGESGCRLWLLNCTFIIS